MNFSAIVMCTVLALNGSCGPTEMLPKAGKTNSTLGTKKIESSSKYKITLMEGYERYLGDPKFELPVYRHA